MGYVDTTGVIIYWKLDQPFVIHKGHHVWYDENNSSLSIKYKHSPGSWLLRQYHGIHVNNSDLLKLIQCELDIASTPFCDTKVLTYEIELPPSGKEFGSI